MKRFSTLIATALLVLAFTAPAAHASSLHVSVSAKQRSASSVEFRAKSSRKASVKVAVYRKGHLVRTLKAKRSGSSYVARWTGGSVRTGVYSYRVTAKGGSSKGITTGKLAVSTTTQVIGSAPASSQFPVQLPGGRWIGLYVPGAPSDMSVIDTAEAVTGVHTSVVNFFVSDSESFPSTRVRNIADHGGTPLVTWEFWSIGSAGLAAIDNGSKDAYIKKFADDAKAYGGTVELRVFHEMNGNWYPWGATVGSNSAAKLVAAWRHVHDIFAAEGATNVKFVFCPNNDSVSGNAGANSITAMWPGDAYVDYAALDGYNAGNTQSWSSWRSFQGLFSASYAELAGLTARPMFIAETSSVESGGSKAQWITDMFTVIPTKFPRIQGVCWFDANQSSDWRIESSTSSAAAFNAGAVKGY